MAYYLETKQWKSLTAEEREKAMEEFYFIQDNLWRLPRGHLITMLSGCYPFSSNTLYAALNFRQFNRDILHSAYIFTRDYLSRGI